MSKSLQKAIFALVVVGVIILVAFLVIEIIGYQDLFTGKEVKPPKEPKDEITIFLETLIESFPKESGTLFSKVRTVELIWMAEKNGGVEELTIKGKGFMVQDVSDEQLREINSIFENKGFTVDLRNEGTDAFSRIRGYKKEKVVCVVIGGASENKKTINRQPLPKLSGSVEVRCGKL